MYLWTRNMVLNFLWNWNFVHIEICYFLGYRINFVKIALLVFVWRPIEENMSKIAMSKMVNRWECLQGVLQNIHSGGTEAGFCWMLGGNITRRNRKSSGTWKRSFRAVWQQDGEPIDHQVSRDSGTFKHKLMRFDLHFCYLAFLENPS